LVFEGGVQYLESWLVENFALMLLVVTEFICIVAYVCVNKRSTHWNVEG